MATLGGFFSFKKKILSISNNPLFISAKWGKFHHKNKSIKKGVVQS
jgi:hypothetical protein